MQTERYELKDADFDVVLEGVDEIRDLSDEHLLALAWSGIDNWSYRAGARKENNGKTFTLLEICDAIIKVGTRANGKPSKNDVSAAESIWANKWAKLNKEQPELTTAQALSFMADWAYKTVPARHAESYGSHWSFEWPRNADGDLLEPKVGFAYVVRAERLAADRQKAAQRKAKAASAYA